ncbi:MAG TPA: NlpC/P60 family protein [Croceibacterium sp.]
MTVARAALAAAAERLIGTPFRLHGRDPARGLDCVGLVAAALAEAGRPVRAPTGYWLRQSRLDGLLDAATHAGLGAAAGAVTPGDVLLVRPGPAQHHLVVAGMAGGFVHAHAGLGRVVLTPAPLAWPIVRHWRLLAE